MITVKFSATLIFLLRIIDKYYNFREKNATTKGCNVHNS